MNLFNNLWYWVGVNSSQLQTFLGLLALILAIFAAKYAKHQIKLAQNQRIDAINLTIFNLKLSILTTAFECKELIDSSEHKHEKLRKTFSIAIIKAGYKMSDKMFDQDYTFEEYIDYPLELFKNPKDVVNDMIKGVSKTDNDSSQKDLEIYLQMLTKIKGSIYSANEGYNRRIDKFEEIINPHSTNISS